MLDRIVHQRGERISMEKEMNKIDKEISLTLCIMLALFLMRGEGFIYLMIFSIFVSSGRFFKKSTPWYLVCLYFLCILVPIEVLSINSFHLKPHISPDQDFLTAIVIIATIPFVLEIIYMRKLFRKRNLRKLFRKLNSTKLFRKRKKT